MSESNCPQGVPLEYCAWMREKEYVTRDIKEIKESLKGFSAKLDDYHSNVLAMGNQNKQVEALETKMSLSREELATMKVKMSLMGVGAAALVEVIFVLARHFQK
jgi:hypothetical protein